MIYIVKGDDTNFMNNQFLNIHLESEQYIDFSKYTCTFKLQNIVLKQSDLSVDFNISLTKAQTSSLRLGKYNATIQLYDSKNRRGTASTLIPVTVTDIVDNIDSSTSVSENYVNIGLTEGDDSTTIAITLTGNYAVWGNIEGNIKNQTDLQEALDAKQDIIMGAITTVIDNDLPSNSVVISNEDGKIDSSEISVQELNQLSGASSNLQAQISNNKTNIQKIEEVIPEEADEDNKLADKSYVNNQIDVKIKNLETFTFTQSTASNVWLINHNLDRCPSCTIIDSAGTEVVGDVIYVDKNNIEVRFSSNFKGIAYLN